MKPPFDGPLDIVSGQPDDGRMDARVTKLEADVSAIKFDVALIKANGATKTDLAELEARMQVKFAELRTEMQGQFAAMETKMQGQFAAIEKKLDGQGSDLNGKIDSLSARVAVSIAQSQVRMIFWIGSFIFLAQLLPLAVSSVREMLAQHENNRTTLSLSAPVSAERMSSIGQVSAVHSRIPDQVYRARMFHNGARKSPRGWR